MNDKELSHFIYCSTNTLLSKDQFKVTKHNKAYFDACLHLVSDICEQSITDKFKSKTLKNLNNDDFIDFLFMNRLVIQP